jgi:hypothetical protein
VLRLVFKHNLRKVWKNKHNRMITEPYLSGGRLQVYLLETDRIISMFFFRGGGGGKVKMT